MYRGPMRLPHPERASRAAGETAATLLADGSGDQSLTKDAIYRILRDSHRRALVRVLASEPANKHDLQTLAEQVLEDEQDEPLDRLGFEERQRMLVALDQKHLPLLRERGVVEYHRQSGIIEPTPALAAFDPYLSRERQSGEPVAQPDTASTSSDEDSS